MNQARIIFVITLIFWLTVGGLVLRTNRLWFGPVTLRWTNLTQPSAVFRWSTAPSDEGVVMAVQTSKTFKVVVPRQFNTGRLHLRVMMNEGGALRVVAPGRLGQPNAMTTISDAFGGYLDLRWDDLAVSVRTFSVQLENIGNQDVRIESISLRLQP